jgi:dihydropyrimidinase
MSFDAIIANGTVVNADGSEQADVAVSGEKIAKVGRGLAKKAGEGARIIDAKGCYVIPGGIDVHRLGRRL